MRLESTVRRIGNPSYGGFQPMLYMSEINWFSNLTKIPLKIYKKALIKLKFRIELLSFDFELNDYLAGGQRFATIAFVTVIKSDGAIPTSSPLCPAFTYIRFCSSIEASKKIG